MKTKSLMFTITDVTVSPNDVQKSLNHACLRGPIYYSLSAVCQVRERIMLVLHEAHLDQPVTYNLAPLAGSTMEEVRADFESHFQGSMQARGIIQLADESYVGIFAKFTDSDD